LLLVYCFKIRKHWTVIVRERGIAEGVGTDGYGRPP